MQLTHHQHTSHSHNKQIIIICENILGPANMGSIFRLADAFGVLEIIFSGNQPDVSSSRLRRTARNTERIVRFRESVNLINTLNSLHEKDFTSIAIEITTTSSALQQIDFSSKENIVLVVGSERLGISESVLNIVNHIAHIPMYGSNSSINVAQATGIALYETTRI